MHCMQLRSGVRNVAYQDNWVDESSITFNHRRLTVKRDDLYDTNTITPTQVLPNTDLTLLLPRHRISMAELDTGWAAAQFAAINELLLMLVEHVSDCGSLRALSLSCRRFHDIFSPKLGERIVFRIKDDEDQEAAERIIDECLIPGPYLANLPHLHLEVNNGPQFPDKTLFMIEKLLMHVPNLKKFTWESEYGDVPVSTLAQLSNTSRELTELQLNCGADLVKQKTNRYPRMKDFDRVRTLTCRRLGVWRALHILHECPNIETAELTEMERMTNADWHPTSYHHHLRHMISHEEECRRHSRKPLTMNLCYSRGAGTTVPCPVCESPAMQHYNPKDKRYQTIWQSWAVGKARQFFTDDGQIRHLSYEYPHPEKKERRY
ncbi:hypothetical protein GGS20DRAFT_597385 [Poronia punctata]|nr:hypothetical protein GGS20DRAFT_597385 [Poronia punctata]